MSTGRCPHIDCEASYQLQKAEDCVKADWEAQARIYFQRHDRLIRLKFKHGQQDVRTQWNADKFGDYCVVHAPPRGTDNPAEAAS
jgi:hypothetical protein